VAPGLSVLAVGEVSAGQFAALLERFQVELIDLQLAPSVAIGSVKGAVNRAIDASAHPWILILRQLETVDRDLAAEIGQAAGEKPLAWGYRLRRRLLYGGKTLLLDDDGEVRLFHRRHCRFDPRSESEEMKVEGPVIRMRNRLRVDLYGSPEEHRAYLAAHAVPHSTVRQALLFVHAAIFQRALRSMAAIRYYWIEAGYDKG
jgi:hypothetical protein